METPDFKLTQLGIVMLGVHDLARSLEFYRDKLGLTVKSEMRGFAFLEAGSVTLALSEPLARSLGTPEGSLAGAAELVFTVEGVREAYEALAARGVNFTHEPRVVAGTQWAANFDDPDGHKLSVFGPERKTS
jgi:catechol 2,3-dioxygenase-like lactoylglutathione lyase family enzyme